MKTIIYISMALALVGLVMATSPFDKGWTRHAYGGLNSLQAFDDVCQKVEVHPGYFVKQIMVRTAKDGLICQFPPANRQKQVLNVLPKVVKIENVSETI